MLTLRVKRLPNGVGLPLPTYATPGASGLDLHAAEDAVIDAGTIVSVGTGFAFEIPEGYEGQVRPRSGLAARHGLTVVNTPGTIDQDYRGEVRVLLMLPKVRVVANKARHDARVMFTAEDQSAVVIRRGDRIAQLVIAPVARVAVVREVEYLPVTIRGDGGFGSTGS